MCPEITICIQYINPDLIGINTKKLSTHNADNGCLGGFDRGRTQTAAILVGEVLTTFDPAVSEWSNPVSRISKLTCNKQRRFIDVIVAGGARRQLKHLT